MILAPQSSIEGQGEVGEAVPEDDADPGRLQLLTTKATNIVNKYEALVKRFTGSLDDGGHWWVAQVRLHTELRPLMRLARRFLAGCASSAASERVFSVTGQTGRPRRMNLTQLNLAGLSFLKANDLWLEKMRSEGHQPMNTI